jgi:hypothetical protein
MRWSKSPPNQLPDRPRPAASPESLHFFSNQDSISNTSSTQGSAMSLQASIGMLAVVTRHATPIGVPASTPGTHADPVLLRSAVEIAGREEEKFWN